MSEKTNKVFGIDLGTTYSCISHVDEHGKAVIISNSEGSTITPSVVFFDDGGENIIVGDAAKESSKMYPDDVVSFVKRSMGDENFLYTNNGKDYSPEEISNYIIRKLVKDAEENLGEEIKDVVITCPAYFGINEREATKKAGEIAGLNVLQIINEPTAAAITYGLKDEQSDRTILVYDLGGGTFDITMVQLSENKIEVVVTGGDHTLGGKDWDDQIINYLVEQYHEQTGKDDDILLDAETFQDLQLVAERAKKSLTTLSKAPIAFTHGTDRIRVELTQEKFKEITAHLVERTISLSNLMLEEAKKKNIEAFDDIILVGGSTRMPQVSEAITREFSKTPKTFEPDEAVAKGAALFGHQTVIKKEVLEIYNKLSGEALSDESLSDDKKELNEKLLGEAIDQVASNVGKTIDGVRREFTQEIVNVSSKSFGVVAYNNEDRKVVFNLILKNTAVPTEFTDKFRTRQDNQMAVKFRIMENEISDDTLEIMDSVEIGAALLELPPGLEAGSPLEVTFKLNEEGRLEITCVERSDNRQVSAVIETKSVISGEALEEAKERSQSISIS